jgi:hypothetical protein
MVANSQEPPSASVPQTKDERPLAKLDLLVLLFLSLLTASIAFATVEFGSRLVFSESETSTLSCMILNDPKTGVRAIPNSVCWQKIKEGPPVEYKFNECGDRTSLACGPKSPNTFRIVSIGASISEGFGVPYNQTFAAQLPRELARLTGRKFDLYNEALEWGGPLTVERRFSHALSVKPNLILWTIHPLDLEMPLLPWWITRPPSREERATPSEVWQRVAAAYRERSFPSLLDHEWHRVVDLLNQTSAVYLLQHLFYLSESQYVKNYLENDNAGFLMKQPSPVWEPYWQQFDEVISAVASQASKAGIPLVVAVIPQRAQAIMISTEKWPRGVDPFAFGDQMKSDVERHGEIYLDLLSGFRDISNPGRLYYPVDGHLNAEGQGAIANLLANAIIPLVKVGDRAPIPAPEGR